MVVKLKPGLQPNSREESFGIEAGKGYVVFFIWIGPQNVEYGLITKIDGLYPYVFPADRYEVVDASMPSGWGVAQQKDNDGRPFMAVGFPGVTEDVYYYSHLLDASAEDRLQLQYNKMRDKYVESNKQLLYAHPIR